MPPHEVAAMAQTLRGLGGLAGAVSNPLTRLALRYWWLSIPVGLSFYGRYKDRKKEHDDMKIYHLMTDLQSSLLPVTLIITLAEFARREERRKVQEAEFSVVDNNNNGPVGYQEGSLP